jgi:methionine biosynthesis protein MetW
MIREALYRLKHGTEFLNYGRHIVEAWAVEHISTLTSAPDILDLGAGDGTDLINLKQRLDRSVNLHGLEVSERAIERARERGISVTNVDIEREVYPFADASIDIVLANQVLEHTKEIFWVFSEVSRILRASGLFVVGVPNLASLHNRVALLFGSQPPSIQVLGPHVRGFTRAALTEFAQHGSFFAVEEIRGSNFYPFPPWLSGRLAGKMPGLAVSLFFRMRRTAKAGKFVEVLDGTSLDTGYFTGGRR